MGKSFHRGTDSYSQKEIFLARDTERKFKHVHRWNNGWEEKQKEKREARQYTLEWVKRLHTSSIQSLLFTRNIHAIDDDIRHALSRGTLQQEFPLLLEDEEPDAIFSAKTKKMMEQVLRANPKLSELYFSPNDDKPLLLEYDSEAEGRQNLSDAQIECIREYVDALLKSLLPPEEIREIMEQALQITTQVKWNVNELQWKIEFLVIKALEKHNNMKSPRKRRQRLQSS